MSRRFAAFVLALMLSCYGFAVLAQSVAGIDRAGGSAATCVSGAALSDPAASNDEAMDAADDAASHDKTGSEHAELVSAWQHAPALVLLSEPPPGLASTPVRSPFLERPKRPPRSTAFVA
jgi:hypothetical protein